MLQQGPIKHSIVKKQEAVDFASQACCCGCATANNMKGHEWQLLSFTWVPAASPPHQTVPGTVLCHPKA
jgi:hypothetical protein